MNKIPFIALGLLLVVFVSGCGVGRQGETFTGGSGAPEQQQTTTSTFPQQQPGIYTIQVGEGVSIDGKVVKVEAVESGSGLVRLNVDGIILEFPTTRLIKIARNLELQTIRVDYGRTPQDHTATVDIKRFLLGPNEFYIKAGESVTVANIEVKLVDLTKTNGARLNINGRELIVDLDRTENLFNLEITHKRAFDNPVKVNRYAVLEIKPIA